MVTSFGSTDLLTCDHAYAGLLIMAFNPLFKLADAHLPAPVILFTTFGGLRGAVSLILAQMLVTQQDRLQKSSDMLQTAQVSSVHLLQAYVCCAHLTRHCQLWFLQTAQASLVVLQA